MTTLASRIFLSNPIGFRYNLETARTNVFSRSVCESEQDLQKSVQKEFFHFALMLENAGIDVSILNGIDEPDAVFPNNWFATFFPSQIFLFPMTHPSRRKERDKGYAQLQKNLSTDKTQYEVIDLRRLELQGEYLEGTGSLILDRKNKIGYAGESSRTTSYALKTLADLLDYQIHSFKLSTHRGQIFYHTNVVFSLGQSLAILYRDAFQEESDCKRTFQTLSDHGYEIIEISLEQVQAFCGNIINLQSKSGIPYWIMSNSALGFFSSAQKKILERSGNILSSDLRWIETIGGGSARCMIAENFLKRD